MEEAHERPLASQPQARAGGDDGHVLPRGQSPALTAYGQIQVDFLQRFQDKREPDMGII